MRDAAYTPPFASSLVGTPYNTTDKVRLFNGALRTGVNNMFGVFATQALREHEFLCAWTGTRVIDDKDGKNTTRIPVNAFDLQMYGISIQVNSKKNIFICPPLDEHGKPLHSVSDDGTPFIQRGDDNQSLGVFFNEPSNTEHAVLEGQTLHVRRFARAANVCLGFYRENGTVIPILCTNRNVRTGEELTLMYEADLTKPTYDRRHFAFSNDFSSVDIGPAYRVHVSSRMVCNNAPKKNVPKFNPKHFILTKRVHARTFLTDGANDTFTSRRTSLLTVMQRNPTQTSIRLTSETQTPDAPPRRIKTRHLDDDKWDSVVKETKDNMLKSREWYKNMLFGNKLQQRYEREMLRRIVLYALDNTSPFWPSDNVEDPPAIYSLFHRLYDTLMSGYTLTSDYVARVRRGETRSTWDDEEYKEYMPLTSASAKRLFEAIDRLQRVKNAAGELYPLATRKAPEDKVVHLIKRSRVMNASSDNRLPSLFNTYYEPIVAAAEGALFEYGLYDEGPHASDLRYFNSIVDLLNRFPKRSDDDTYASWTQEAQQFIENSQNIRHPPFNST